MTCRRPSGFSLHQKPPITTSVYRRGLGGERQVSCRVVVAGHAFEVARAAVEMSVFLHSDSGQCPRVRAPPENALTLRQMSGSVV